MAGECRGAGGSEPEGHVAGFDRLDILLLVGRARLHHAFYAGGALLSGVDELSEGGFGVGDDQLEQAVELAILKDYAGSAEGVEIGEDLCGSGYLRFFAGYVDGVGAEVDGDVESIF